MIPAGSASFTEMKSEAISHVKLASPATIMDV